MKKLQAVAAPVATSQSDFLDDVAVCLECSGETFNRLAALMLCWIVAISAAWKW